MKKKIALLLALVLVFSLAAVGCGSSEEEASGEKVVKIGVFEPASGDNGAGGKQETLGVKYAHDLYPTVTIGDEEYDVEVVYVDNESNPNKGITAAQSLVAQGVSLVLGTYGSSVAIAAADVFDEAQVPAIGITCTNQAVTEASDWYYRICFTDPFQSTILANYAYQKGMTKVYALNQKGDDYSGNLCLLFTNAFEALGGEVYRDEFPEGTSDFTSYINKAKEVGANGFFSPVSTASAGMIIPAAASQELGMPILAGDTWDSNVITEAAKKAYDENGKEVQIWVSTFYQEGGNVDFDTNIKAWIEGDSTNLAENGGNSEVAAVTAMGYDAYIVALEALKAAGSTDPLDVQAVLPSLTVSADKLVCGEVVFDEIGDAIKDVAYIKTVVPAEGVWALEGEVTM